MHLVFTWLVAPSCFFTAVRALSSYSVVREYSDDTFFDRWTQFGSWDNLTNGACLSNRHEGSRRILVSHWLYVGNANFLDQQAAVSEHLIYTNSDGRAVIKVDNTSVVSAPADRNSVHVF